MKTQVKNANANATSKKQTTTASDDMEKAVAKAERLAKAEAYKAERLKKATARLELIKQGAKEGTIGFANVTLKRTRQFNAMNANVQGAIDSLNAFIKQVAIANNFDKQIISALKSESAQTILQQVNETTLPLYIDNKGNYKVESLYRLVASKAKNSELRTLLNNMNKAAK